jgi:hypothetical protein
MPKLLTILCPPRSFSSVVSTMIGEHPDLYGFPELHLFVGDTVQEVIDREHNKSQRYAGPPGMLRTLAQLHDGIQTTGTIVHAITWLSERRDWTTQRLMDYLLERVAPKIGVEKSPVTSLKPKFMERAYAHYPGAYYLHLTRHPVSTRASMREFSSYKQSKQESEAQQRADRLMAWHHIHSNILRFTRTLPLGQTLRVKGEDVLSDPDRYLPQIAEWMGIRTDAEATEAMKHPERSPYACVGPDPARGGNDPKFMRSPKLRGGRIKEPSLRDFLAAEKVTWFAGVFTEAAKRSGLRVASDRQVIEEITGLAHMLGYT